MALPNRNTTFDGRDVFSPLAAHVATGTQLEDLGDPIEVSELVPFTRAAPRAVSAGVWDGEILHVDRFGNLITNLPTRLGEVASIMVEGIEVQGPAHASYAQSEPGTPMVVAGSSDFLEISVNHGDAARLLGVHRGTMVRLRVNSSQSHL